MSRYSDISKKIGWDRRTVVIPTAQRAQQLKEEALAGDEQAFESVFRINRHAEPKTEEEIEPMNIIFSAFSEAKYLYE